MPNTARLALPYPSPSDAPNGPTQIAALTTALEGLRQSAVVGLNTNVTPFSSDGFVYLVPFVSGNGFLTGAVSLPTSYRLTVTKAGIYWVGAQARLTRASASALIYTVQVRKNSGGSGAGGTPVVVTRGPGATDTALSTSTLVTLAANDYLEMFVTGITGTTVQSSVFDTFLALKLGPF